MVVAFVVVEFVAVSPVRVVAPKLTEPPVKEPVTVRSPVTVVVASELVPFTVSAPAREVAPLAESEVAEMLVPEIEPPVMVESASVMSSRRSIRDASPTAAKLLCICVVLEELCAETE